MTDEIQLHVDMPTIGTSSEVNSKPEWLTKFEKRTNGKSTGAKQPASVQPTQVQLPFWPEDRRGMPNTFLRSALFTCRRHDDKRNQFLEFQLPSTSDFVITYTGLELSQDDEDVYQEIIHRSRQFILGEEVAFSAYEVLKSLGWGTSSREYKRLQDSIHRLKNSSLKIVHNAKKKGYAGSLIRKYAFDEMDESGKTRYKVWLEPELVNQFQSDMYTHIRHEQRKKLGKAGLAKWLLSYYSTHADPNGMKSETIRIMSGSDIKVLSQFRYKCKQAHDRLVSTGFLKNYVYDPKTDIFKVVRS